ncbi:MAG: phosphate signaling complex protein PhoU [Rhodospirillales bacterium]|nr:phosphate signaling complex protein PhoU [Rhodospirillales bacterium]
MSTTQHTVRSYDSELEELDRHILAMGGLVEDQLRNAIRSLVEGDRDLARRIIDIDPKIDQHERDVDELVTRMIALRQPMAEDLRRIKTALKVGSNLERMGDLAANIAKRGLVIKDAEHVPQREALKRLGNAVHAMTTDVMDAFRDGDADLAQRVWRQDESTDEMYNSIFLAILADMIADPRLIAPGTHIHFVAKNIERVGDHATNIAEMVTYMILGSLPDRERPKSNSVVGVDQENEESGEP